MGHKHRTDPSLQQSKPTEQLQNGNNTTTVGQSGSHDNDFLDSKNLKSIIYVQLSISDFAPAGHTNY